jgi:hypothetical protein
MKPRFLADVADSSSLIENTQALEEGIRQLAERAAESLGAERCSVMLVSDDGTEETRHLRVYSHFGDLPAEAYNQPVALNSSIAGRVFEEARALLITDVATSHVQAMARQGPDAGGSFMSAPVPLAGRPVGVINISRGPNREPFDEHELGALELLAFTIGESIRIFQLQRLADSRLLQMSAVLDSRADQGSTPGYNSIAPEPSKLAKMVAKGFYGELAQAGFGTNAIVSVATEVIGLLSENLNKHQQFPLAQRSAEPDGHQAASSRRGQGGPSPRGGDVTLCWLSPSQNTLRARSITAGG